MQKRIVPGLKKNCKFRNYAEEGWQIPADGNFILNKAIVLL